MWHDAFVTLIQKSSKKAFKIPIKWSHEDRRIYVAGADDPLTQNVHRTFADAKRFVLFVDERGFLFPKEKPFLTGDDYQVRSITHCRAMIGIPYQDKNKLSNKGGLNTSQQPQSSMQNFAVTGANTTPPASTLNAIKIYSEPSYEKKQNTWDAKWEAEF